MDFAVFFSLFSDVTVKIYPPKLNEGMAQLESLIAENLVGPEVQVEEFINSSLTKPNILKGFTDANILCAAAAGTGFPSDISFHAVSFNNYMSFTSNTFFIEEVQYKIDHFQPEKQDIYLGTSLQGLVLGCNIPLYFTRGYLTVNTNLGYSNISYQDFSIYSTIAGFSLLIAAIKPIPINPFITWTGLTGQIGYSHSENKLSYEFSPGTITNTFEADPDGPSGPVLGTEVEVNVTPSLVIGLNTAVHTTMFNLLTGISFFNIFTFSFGPGFVQTFCQTSITIQHSKGPAEIKIIGYLSNLISKPAKIEISGTPYDNEYVISKFYLTGKLELNFARTFIIIPILYSFDHSISSGLTIGARF